MQTETDAQLVARIRAGDLTAFEEIVNRHRWALVAVAAGRLGSLTDAEDVAQEAFIQAYLHFRQIRKPEALLPWLRRTADRLALMRLRGRREEPVPPAELERARSPQAQADEVCRIDALLGKLPAYTRQAVILTYLAGYTCAETAALLGVREGTVKSRLSRARTKLKEALGMAKETMKTRKPKDKSAQRRIARLMREARRLLKQGDIEGASNRAAEVIQIQVRQLFASGDDPDFKFNEEAARIYAMPRIELRRKQCEENAALYGFKLEDLDWEVAEVDLLSNTRGTPTGRGKDIWGVPHSRMKLKVMDSRDICRRLRCSPRTLWEWVQQGCPALRCWPHVRFDLDLVKKWLADQGITDWPKESDYDLDVTSRVLWKALYRQEITPEEVERITLDLDLPC